MDKLPNRGLPPDMRHFAFERNSRLPHGTFGRKRRTMYLAIAIICAVIAVSLAVLLLKG